ncbi:MULTISPECIES: hypothetical protein [unclassified Saccharopolyspora]|uniref:hypothetical protein n=1 Tax=unclassified Saccharopolyspora TaxID=2646250 RepID=UPI001CD674FF|nr:MULTISPECIES: hypothetical protein [unclassified Saccharopolyspora]MCA1186702.1 hypothetical protein [Saccharopolyspora sp. 6T]MCA1278357.1 hypothetical protein [Saccharopolyspora sp. 7B]
MLSVVPSRYLAQRIARADETAEHAADQLYRLRMLEVSQLVRDVLPQAAALVVAVRRTSTEVCCALAEDERQLWSTGDDAPVSEDPGSAPWTDVLERIQYALTSALGIRSPQDRWQRHESANDRFYVDLHGDDEISAATSVVPGAFGAKLCAEGGDPLWLVEPTSAPTMTVGGVHIAARISKDGHLLIDVSRERAGKRYRRPETEVQIDVRVDGMNAFPTAS